MMSVRKAKAPTISTIDSLEHLASRLLVGGDGNFSFYDRPPQVAGTIRSGDVANWIATAATPFGWVLFWSKYMGCLTAREHFLLWADRELQKRKIKPEHSIYLKHLVANNFCHGQKLSAKRIAKNLRVGRNNTAVKYVGILDKILYVASISEEDLGRLVRKITR